jgi:hypothetical protein
MPDFTPRLGERGKRYGGIAQPSIPVHKLDARAGMHMGMLYFGARATLDSAEILLSFTPPTLF